MELNQQGGYEWTQKSLPAFSLRIFILLTAFLGKRCSFGSHFPGETQVKLGFPQGIRPGGSRKNDPG
jgi:hypothetical protein